MKKIVVEITVGSIDGVNVWGKHTEEFVSMEAAATAIENRLNAGYGMVVPTTSGLVILPNLLLKQSVIRLRDTSDDKNVPF